MTVKFDGQDVKPANWDGGEKLPTADVTAGLIRQTNFSELPTQVKLQYLAEHRMPVYVLNKTRRPRSSLNITVTSGRTGKSTAIFIPAVPAPFTLTDYVSAEDLASSRDIIALVNKGVVEIVVPKIAEDKLRDPDMRAMIQREVDKFEKGSAAMQRQEKDRAASLADEDRATGPSPKIMNLVAQFKSTEITAKDLLMEFKALKHVLTSADCTYILAEAKSSKVQEWILEVQAELQKGRQTLGDDAKFEG